VKWSSNLEASMLINLSTTFPDGTTEKYVGTLGNFNLTAGSGTFKWHGYWSNTLDFGKLALTGTVNYTSGYDLSAMDQGNEYKDCGLSPGYGDCHVSKYITFDLNTNFKVTDKVNFYVNVINLFDNLPDIDPVTYGAFLYNSVQAGEGVYGRIFRAGARFKF
jgi:iron complex outermembrane receptor protein